MNAPAGTLTAKAPFSILNSLSTVGVISVSAWSADVMLFMAVIGVRVIVAVAVIVAVPVSVAVRVMVGVPVIVAVRVMLEVAVLATVRVKVAVAVVERVRVGTVGVRVGVAVVVVPRVVVAEGKLVREGVGTTVKLGVVVEVVIPAPLGLVGVTVGVKVTVVVMVASAFGKTTLPLMGERELCSVTLAMGRERSLAARACPTFRKGFAIKVPSRTTCKMRANCSSRVCCMETLTQKDMFQLSTKQAQAWETSNQRRRIMPTREQVRRYIKRHQVERLGGLSLPQGQPRRSNPRNPMTGPRHQEITWVSITQVVKFGSNELGV